MAIDNRRIITWSLNATRAEYKDDLEKYSHKIYSIGLHEFGVTAEGKIYDFRTNQNYFDASGNHTGIRFPIDIEQQMIDYPSIKWYLQMILFGWSKVKPVLDNNQVNSEGRLPQDQFVYELNKILDIYEASRNTGTPLGVTGVEMDVEASMTSDYVSQGNDVNYIHFLEKIKNEVIIPRNKRLRVNAHAMWGTQTPYYYRFHNYKLFAESTDMNGNATIDEIQLMTYDFHWNGSSAGASTPIWWFRDVGEWCLDNFDPSRNPNAKLTIDNLYFGAAAYGHRWGMYDQDVVKSGSTITFRNLLGWQNGQYRHYHTETDTSGNTVYVYHNQPYLFQAGTQDPESKNQVMYPHVYDMFEPKYAKVTEQHGGQKSAVVSTYNSVPYAATNFKIQMPKWTNVHDIARIPSNVSGKAFAVVPSQDGLNTSDPNDYEALRQYDPNLNPDSVDFKHLVRTVDGTDYVFVGYYTLNPRWKPVNEYDETGKVIGATCELESEPHGRIEYTVNVPSSKSYRVVAITSFSWYSQSKLGGTINGQSFTIGGDLIPEWYPFFLKGSHFYDVGTFSLNSGSNTIVVDGSMCDSNTPIYGFIVCDTFDQNFSGGELSFNANIQPFKKKDGTNAAIPSQLALAAKMLRRDARPAILWDDEFRTYGEGIQISGTTYYREAEQGYKIAGGGSNAEDTGRTDSNGNPIYECYSDPKNVGYTQGYWTQQDDGTGRQCVHFDSSDSQNIASSAQLVLSKQWSANLSIEARIKVVRGGTVGIRFYAQNAGSVADGYIFLLDFNRGIRELILENSGSATTVASQPIGNVEEGQTITLQAILHNGTGRFYVGGVKAFIQDDSTTASTQATKVTHNGSVNVSTGDVTLSRSSGACGVYANSAKIYCYHLGIATTDRWETMEKFEVTIDGVTKEFGQIARSGYSYDEFGYLVYSGIDEKVTRDDGQEDSDSVSLDYEITVIDWNGWQGAKDVKIKLRDAGVWFGQLLIGDKQGMSVIWAGDAWSFLDAMNMAVNDYGAKGIGLWTMGQEDPKLFELVPDVVPKK
ncbi:hypothetical protein [Terrihalobacillus insolitus]|uniref:hypothetical protein n=1 Tax=Terrihalobacillus insolitus TaxID=2950438 RepID=UPI002340255E|nr:hypothetical protein [Terrihalobacillus insolitus]MDC3413952.1 hypothetical protein [Terrihalobacillus insolitus]